MSSGTVMLSGKWFGSVFKRRDAILRSSLLLPILTVLAISFAVTPPAFSQIVMLGMTQEQDFVRSFAFGGQSDTVVRNQLFSEAEHRIIMVDDVAELQDVQKQKLRAAADTDVRRFFREVSRIRDQLKKNLGQNDFNEAWQVVMPLQMTMQQGLFLDGSLFDRVVQSTLTRGQEKAFRAELKRRRSRRLSILTRVNLAEIERESMPLTIDKREKLLEILDSVELPDSMTKQMDPYAGYLKLLVISDRDNELKTFLTDKEIKVIDQYRQRYQGWEAMVNQ